MEAIRTSITSSFQAAIKNITANPAGAVILPKVKDSLAERILPEWVVQTMIGLEPLQRNRALLKLLYIGERFFSGEIGDAR